MKRLLLVLALAASACAATSEDADLPITARRAGLEVRGYPAGVTIAAHSLWPAGTYSAWHVSAGANVTDRGDWGEHDDEEGFGSGVGGGWRRFTNTGRVGFFWGGRVDVWSLEIDWEDDSGEDGTSDVFVLQPTMETGYAWNVGGPWVIELGAAFGYEINVDTDGEDVGEGPIGLGLFTVAAGF